MSAARGPYFWLSAVCASLMAIGVVPIVSLFLALGVASALGCAVSEGGTLPCSVMGVDLGDTLPMMAMIGWLGVFTLPLGAAALAVWLVAWMWQRRRHRPREA
jgi:hypothetical protein